MNSMSGYRWKKLVKPDWKIPEVPQGKIVIATDSAGHRRVFIGKANVQKFFGKNALWVELYYDEDGNAIAFKPVPRRTKDAYRMHSYAIPISGIEKEFGFKDGVYEISWDKERNMLIARIEKVCK